MQDDPLGLYAYSVKRAGVVHILRTCEKFRIDLEHLANLYRQYQHDRHILEYFKMTLNLNLDSLFTAEVAKHGGLAALSTGKNIDTLTKWFKDLLSEHAKDWADAEKKKQENEKKRRAYIYQVFAELSDEGHLAENTLIKGVLQLSGVGLKELIAQEEAIKRELDQMGEEQKIGWVKKGEGPAGIVLLEDEKGKDTDAAAVWTKKVQNFRPLRGRAASDK